MTFFPPIILPDSFILTSHIKVFVMSYTNSICILACCLITHSVAAQESIDFAHEIVPILKKHCFECHAGKEAKGGFSVNSRQHFIADDYALPGDAAGSYFLDLIKSVDPETQMPPVEKERVSPKEIKLLEKWVNLGMPWEEGLTFAEKVYEPPLKPYSVELPPPVNGRSHPIDRLLDQYFQKNGMTPPAPLSDAAFYRRVSLDLIGLLPTPSELEDFLRDQSLDKRDRLVEELLARDISYADHWLTFWNDLLRNDYTGTGFITGGRKQISRWLYDSLLANQPYDQFVHELVAPQSDASRGFIDGIKWRGEVSAGQTLEIQFSQSISQSLLGLNMKCASCHDSFIDRWTLKDAYGLAAIYSQRELMIHRCDKPVGEVAQASWLFPELGNVDPTAPQPERLKQLASLMTHPDNGRLTRTIANRFWAQLMGRGIVHPLDAMQSEPWHPELLEVLSNQLREQNYNLKALLRFIATSQAYQSQTVICDEMDDVETFKGPLSKRMTAEQFLDAVWQITETAPLQMNAPVIRFPLTPEEAASVERRANWIWKTPAEPTEENPIAVPTGGETAYLRKTLTLEAVPVAGVAAVTCDNEYVLFINNQEVSRGQNWQAVDVVPFHYLLKQGENEIVAWVKNGDSSPNPAGFYLEGTILTADGNKFELISDETWEANHKAPQQVNRRLPKIADEWQPAHVVNELSVWKLHTENQVKLFLARGSLDDLPFVRASLMNNDFLMKSLGRPLREQIVSSRPSELSTLEAIDLTNGETLAKTLQRGAFNLFNDSPISTGSLVRQLYQAAYSRSPSERELQAVLGAIDNEPSQEEIEDLLWVIFLSPEFMLIR